MFVVISRDKPWLALFDQRRPQDLAFAELCARHMLQAIKNSAIVAASRLGEGSQARTRFVNT
jgi:hypothetical protein